MNTLPHTQLELFPEVQRADEQLQRLTSLHELRRIYFERVHQSKGRGIDRLDAQAFERNLDEHLDVIRRKARSDTYQFSPYAELLRLKGRGKEPRVISIPTLRDRVLLYALKEVLHTTFSDIVPRRLPNTRVRDLCGELSHVEDLRQYTCLRCDITNYYGSIVHERLKEQLATRLGLGLVTRLVMQAVSTSTLQPGTRVRRSALRRPKIGVPQGLSISNVLANIYAQPIDLLLACGDVVADRYVDDIVVVARSDKYAGVEADFYRTLAQLGLTRNPTKTGVGPATESIHFLGYSITWPLVSVKASSVDRFLAGIAARLTAFRRGETLFRAKHPWITPAMYRDVLVEDLNEKITGATSGLRRYGWMFYFLDINDMALLDSMDAAISRMVRRVPEFSVDGLLGLKSLKRAFYEARHNPRGSYIMQYDAIERVAQKRAFLERRGHVQPGAPLSDREIEYLFDRVKKRRLARLDADLTAMS